MSSTPGPERPRKPFFERFTEPFADLAREKIGQAEDRVREAIQAEIDAVSASVRARAIEARPSAIGFGAAALLTFFGLALFVTAAVIGLSHAVEPWLAAILVGVALIAVAAGLAAWARHRLPKGQPMSMTRAHQVTHPAEEHVHPWSD